MYSSNLPRGLRSEGLERKGFMGLIFSYPGATHPETGGPARLPAQIAGRWGHKKCNSVRQGKKYFDKSSQGRVKVSCIRTTSPSNQLRKDPFHLYSLYSLSPHSPQFQQLAEATPLWSLWPNLRNKTWPDHLELHY